MSDEKQSNPSPEKKLENNNKIILKEENENSINIINKVEQEPNDIKEKNIKTSKITKEFVEQTEEKEINIKYKQNENKITAMTLDLLLTKIVTENFVEENPIKIYSFCQQCFCFLDKEILFNKIFNCYDFYKKKKVNIIQICNLIKFLDILVIEMYDYYNTIIHLDEPIITSLDNFYQLLLKETIDLINDKEKAKEESIDFNSKEFENTIEDNKNIDNNLINDKNDDIIKDRYCIHIPNTNEINIRSRDRFNTFNGKIKEKNINIKTEPNTNLNKINNNKIPISKDIQNIPRVNNKHLITKKIKKNEIIKINNKYYHQKEEKNGFTNIFIDLKKDKPIKLKNKNDNEQEITEKEKDKPKLYRINALKKENTTPEAEILSEITNIKVLFSYIPKKRELEQTKKKIKFYKDIQKKLAEAIGKPFKDSPVPKSRHTFTKSVTVGNLSKKHKIKMHTNDGFFDVLDWDQKEIGEKLISISKNLINKVQRRELYKALFLKEKKHETCPNVMENIDKFNRLNFFIMQNILSYDFAKDRAKIIEKWIQIAEYCKERKDYNDCLAINLSLNSYIITGLNKTMNDIGKDKKELMKNINRFCRYQGNYKKLREDMAKLEYNDFYIPYLGIVLKDISFFEENSKYIINDVLINFEKLENVQLSISSFFHFQNTKDKINPIIPEELNFFDNLEDLKETDLEDLANKLEPEFKLYANKKREKRLTNIDKTYFMDPNVNRPNMKDSKKLVKK